MSLETDKARHRDFAKSYEQTSMPAMRKLERNVLGCEYGGTSWTTFSEAKQISVWLELSKGVRLLELGAGSGWPGLLVASLTGCEVFLTDILLVGLRQASDRAGEEGINKRVQTIAASAAQLPL